MLWSAVNYCRLVVVESNLTAAPINTFTLTMNSEK